MAPLDALRDEDIARLFEVIRAGRYDEALRLYRSLSPKNRELLAGFLRAVGVDPKEFERSLIYSYVLYKLPRARGVGDVVRLLKEVGIEVPSDLYELQKLEMIRQEILGGRFDRLPELCESDVEKAYAIWLIMARYPREKAIEIVSTFFPEMKQYLKAIESATQLAKTVVERSRELAVSRILAEVAKAMRDRNPVEIEAIIRRYGDSLRNVVVNGVDLKTFLEAVARLLRDNVFGYISGLDYRIKLINDAVKSGNLDMAIVQIRYVEDNILPVIERHLRDLEIYSRFLAGLTNRSAGDIARDIERIRKVFSYYKALYFLRKGDLDAALEHARRAGAKDIEALAMGLKELSRMSIDEIYAVLKELGISVPRFRGGIPGIRARYKVM